MVTALFKHSLFLRHLRHFAHIFSKAMNEAEVIKDMQVASAIWDELNM